MYRNLKEISFEGETLKHAGGGYQEGNIISQFFVNDIPDHSITPNHYRVTWDLGEFYQQYDAGGYNWPYPHSGFIVEEEEKENTLDYYRSKKNRPLNKTVYDKNGKGLTIINVPNKFSPTIGDVHYMAAAVDEDENVYKVFWNMLNIFDPTKVEMTVNNGRYCKKCLKRWTNTAHLDIFCQHEWADV